PVLWSGSSPRTYYLQAQIDGRKTGPAVVLQPIVAPLYAPRADRSGSPIFPEDKAKPRLFSGYRAYMDRHVVLETGKGEIEVALRPDAAPNTSFNFRQLVEGGFYTDIAVHRIASLVGGAAPDVVQFGDPNGDGRGGPGYQIDLEPSAIPHDYGVVSMARSGDV